jgi:hypothetical protein
LGETENKRCEEDGVWVMGGWISYLEEGCNAGRGFKMVGEGGEELRWQGFGAQVSDSVHQMLQLKP